MSTDTDTMPPDTVLWFRRRDAAVGWRWQHLHWIGREREWRAFVTGALWQKRGSERRAIALGLADAERAVPFDPSRRP